MSTNKANSKAYNKSSVEHKFDIYYKQLIDEIIKARMHLRLYKRLQEAKRNYLKELNQAPGFFSFTINAHRDAGLMSMFRLLKKQDNSLTVWKFLDFVDSNLEPLFSSQAFAHRNADKWFAKDKDWHHHVLTHEDVENDRNALKEFEKTIENLIMLRDKKVAHIDQKFTLSAIDVSKEFPIKLTELERITAVIADILNKYSVAYDSSTYSVDMSGDYGVQVMLDAIRHDLERRDEQRARLIDETRK